MSQKDGVLTLALSAELTDALAGLLDVHGRNVKGLIVDASAVGPLSPRERTRLFETCERLSTAKIAFVFSTATAQQLQFFNIAGELGPSAKAFGSMQKAARFVGAGGAESSGAIAASGTFKHIRVFAKSEGIKVAAFGNLMLSRWETSTVAGLYRIYEVTERAIDQYGEVCAVSIAPPRFTVPNAAYRKKLKEIVEQRKSTRVNCIVFEGQGLGRAALRSFLAGFERFANVGFEVFDDAASALERCRAEAKYTGDFDDGVRELLRFVG